MSATQDVDTLTSRSGLITGAGGSAIPFSELTEAAASDVTKEVQVALKPREEFRILGTDRGKSDARAIVDADVGADGGQGAVRV